MLKAATLNAMNDMPREDAFRAARAIVGHMDGIEFGIEYLSLPTGHEVAYVNTGDTYNGTLLLVRENWIYASWGDVLEASEQEHAENTGETRCPWCGTWAEELCHLEDGTSV